MDKTLQPEPPPLQNSLLLSSRSNNAANLEDENVQVTVQGIGYILQHWRLGANKKGHIDKLGINHVSA